MQDAVPPNNNNEFLWRSSATRFDYFVFGLIHLFLTIQTAIIDVHDVHNKTQRTVLGSAYSRNTMYFCTTKLDKKPSCSLDS